MTMAPKRIQRQRTKGWRMPKGAIYVGRPSRWGNPWPVENVRAQLAMAQELAGWIDSAPGWERLAPVPFSTVVFRFAPERMSEAERDVINEQALHAVNATGEVFLSHTRIGGHYALRMAIGNLRTQLSHVRRAWELLNEAVTARP